MNGRLLLPKPFLLFVFVMLALLCTTTRFVDCSSASSSPYSILGLPNDAPQDEIKRSYRKLCLKYHPDKNVEKGLEERQRCEEQFKRIQFAYSQVGDEDSRRKYDLMSSMSQYDTAGSAGSGTPRGSAPFESSSASEAFFRSFYAQHGRAYPYGNSYRRYAPRRTPFYFNGVDISNLFSVGQDAGSFFGGHMGVHNPDVPKSVFLQHVKVPLEDLYAGRNNMEFVLHDNAWQRYRAAFRGGVARSIAIQGFFTSLTLLLRVSLPVTAAFFAAFFHLSLPRPTKLFYDARIKRGWKGGTRLKFDALEHGLEVVFILEEKRHPRFKREGNDLRTSVKVAKSKAKKGCTVFIEPLSESELPIMVELRPRQITHDRQIVTVKGRGWPNTKGAGRGDLLIEVQLISDTQQRKQEGGSRKRRQKGIKRRRSE